MTQEEIFVELALRTGASVDLIMKLSDVIDSHMEPIEAELVISFFERLLDVVVQDA